MGRAFERRVKRIAEIIEKNKGIQEKYQIKSRTWVEPPTLHLLPASLAQPLPLRDARHSLPAVGPRCRRHHKPVRVVPPVDLEAPRPVQVVVGREVVAVRVDQVAKEHVVPECRRAHAADLGGFGQSRFSNFGHCSACACCCCCCCCCCCPFRLFSADQKQQKVDFRIRERRD